MKKAATITETQLRALKVIQTESRWVSPSYSEIAEKMETTPGSVRNIINRLISKGLLTHGPGRYNNLVVTDTGLMASRKRTPSKSRSTK